MLSINTLSLCVLTPTDGCCSAEPVEVKGKTRHPLESASKGKVLK